ncbi:hypothetical protein HK096_005035 [Nowakowskiella sp. JEL0078]|nr:hypothetical protein HK096_005035 [Nowakowskiella sp. JEL0078]
MLPIHPTELSANLRREGLVTLAQQQANFPQEGTDPPPNPASYSYRAPFHDDPTNSLASQHFSPPYNFSLSSLSTPNRLLSSSHYPPLASSSHSYSPYAPARYIPNFSRGSDLAWPSSSSFGDVWRNSPSNRSWNSTMLAGLNPDYSLVEKQEHDHPLANSNNIHVSTSITGSTQVPSITQNVSTSQPLPTHPPIIPPIIKPDPDEKRVRKRSTTINTTTQLPPATNSVSLRKRQRVLQKPSTPVPQQSDTSDSELANSESDENDTSDAAIASSDSDDPEDLESDLEATLVAFLKTYRANRDAVLRPEPPPRELWVDEVGCGDDLLALGSVVYKPPRRQGGGVSNTKLWLLPRFTDKQIGGVLEVRVAREYLSMENLAVSKSLLWGTRCYTDDSDIVAMAIHCGMYVPSDFPHGIHRNVKLIPPSTTTEDPIDDSPTHDEPDHDLVVHIQVLPRLKRYSGSLVNGIRSRSWGGLHDGLSLLVRNCEIVPLDSCAPKGRKSLPMRSDIANRVGHPVLVQFSNGEVCFKYEPRLLVDWPTHLTDLISDSYSLDIPQRARESVLKCAISGATDIRRMALWPYWRVKMVRWQAELLLDSTTGERFKLKLDDQTSDMCVLFKGEDEKVVARVSAESIEWRRDGVVVGELAIPVVRFFWVVLNCEDAEADGFEGKDRCETSLDNTGTRIDDLLSAGREILEQEKVVEAANAMMQVVGDGLI